MRRSPPIAQHIEDSQRSVARDAAFFVALLATAVALAGAGAHALSLANKMRMSAEAYFIAQQAYRGWSLLGIVLAVQLFGILTVIALYRSERRVVRPAVVALVALIAAQAVFWIWTFPANQATSNWTAQPDDWEALRAQWEYSHLAGAGFQLVAMMALFLAVLRRP
jgi:hypothetical protein